jgi:hypothetical protein
VEFGTLLAINAARYAEWRWLRVLVGNLVVAGAIQNAFELGQDAENDDARDYPRGVWHPNVSGFHTPP